MITLEWSVCGAFVRYISLGLSCQTRYLLDSYIAEFSRFPFDYNITSRAALLGVLRRERSLKHTEEEAELYRIPAHPREGIRANGVFFWHDYPLQKHQLSPDWRNALETVNSKYESLTQRLFDVLSDASIPKRIVLSNTQRNLDQFAEG